MTTIDPRIETLCVNTIRALAIDTVLKANSGHPGLPLGAAPVGYALFARAMKHNPANPAWPDRDRFVLSAGHGSALLYSLLHLTGYALPLDELKQFRQWGSHTPGHPEYGDTPGVEVTTGPLGQGFGNGVGMAMAEAFLAARYNRPGHAIIDHYTYGLVSDGDLMEGVASEAASLAGHLRLGKLIYLYDDNHISLSAATALTFTEDVARRFDAYRWDTQIVADGNDVEAINRALRKAREEVDRPSLILVRTHLGYGAPHKQDTFAAHGAPLGNEEVKLTKDRLGWPQEPRFYVPEPVRAHFREAVERGRAAEAAWKEKLAAYAKAFPDSAMELGAAMAGQLPAGWEGSLPSFPADAKGMATRVAAGRVLECVAARVPTLIGGSADLDPSTHTLLKGLGDFAFPGIAPSDTQGAAGGGWSYAGRNIHFGVREHAMGTILNGLAAHGGMLPFGATFLIFSDYMRPPIRLAALMGLHVIYLFTHDSIGLGEDGPTHQPVEHLAGLRAIPRLLVIRPADANETVVAWRVALQMRQRPVALVLSRQSVPTLDRARYATAEGLQRGAYILAESPGEIPEVILIASGSEVGLIVAAREKLARQGVRVRLVSMPSWELFEAQPREYRESVLPPSVRARLTVEAGTAQGWSRYVGDAGDIIAMDRFGASASGEVVMREYGFTVEAVCRCALTVLNGVRAGQGRALAQAAGQRR